MKVNSQQLRRIHALLREANQQEQKTALVFRFSKGRGESSRALLFNEAQELIQHLNGILNLNSRESACQRVSANQMRRKVISIAHNMKWQKQDGTIDMARLNDWCLNYSYLKKELQQYSYKQLPTLISQFQEVYYSFIKNISNA